ncbi:MAG: hypothetical protein Sylvanvirus21_1 [Sylvanvirus sp.]|uniref:Uncharacterized protein n=1 Tax=Sylvanvirus sp. TaxID=2487774 RepID=A0A3G5AM06_9VIRU|nr:MAG: hypothetical protein Sylvanvirus21_1 [Sylvanvirus sp.]
MFKVLISKGGDYYPPYNNENENKNPSFHNYKHLMTREIMIGSAAATLAALAASRFRVCQPHQYMVRTGVFIKEMMVSKKGFHLPFQKCSFVNMSPASFSFELHHMSKDKVPFNLPISLTVSPFDYRVKPELFLNYARTMSALTDSSIENTIKSIANGEMRVLSASRTIEEMFSGREEFKRYITDIVQSDFNNFGLEIKNANIEEMKDLPNNFDFKKINRIVGIDPGYTTLFSASTSNDRLKKDCISLSTKQYRHESKMHEQRYYYQNFLKHNPELTTIILATPSFKTADPEEILKGIDFLVEHADMLFQAFRKSALPKFKFKVKTFSAKTLTQHCKKVVGPTPKTCVVGVGDWSQKRNGFLKGGVGASPNKKFLKELKQRQGVTVVLIDEYNTSQFCFKCKSKLEPVYLKCKLKRQEEKQEPEAITRKVHHVLHCSNNECGMYWNRDINSSHHHQHLMFNLATKKGRPSYLMRIQTNKG